MSNIISEFDPSVTPPGIIQTFQHSEYGLYITNASVYGLRLSFGQGVANAIVPAMHNKPLHICITGDTFTWSIAYTLPTGGQTPPASLVVIEVFQQSELGDLPTVSTSLPYLTSIGNAVPIGTAVMNVVNDGNAPGTNVIEATPAGGGSELVWRNDGSGVFGGGHVVVSSTGIFTSLPAGAIPFAHGLQDAAGTYNAPITADTVSTLLVINSQTTTPLGVSVEVYDGTTQRQGIGMYPDASMSLIDGQITISNAGIFTSIPAGAIPTSALSGAVPSAALLSGGPIATYANAGASVDGIATETPGGNPRTFLFQSWDGSIQHNALSIGGAFHASAQFLDNGALRGSSSAFASGTGSGTVSHSFGATPTICLVTDDQSNATMTVGYDSLGGSTVHINTGASHSWKALLM